MTLDEIRRLLKKDNGATRPADCEMYAQQFATYFEAVQNIHQNGAIVSHPRTGQPMENPYLKLRAAAETSMKNLGRVKTDALWAEAVKRLGKTK